MECKYFFLFLLTSLLEIFEVLQGIVAEKPIESFFFRFIAFFFRDVCKHLTEVAMIS